MTKTIYLNNEETNYTIDEFGTVINTTSGKKLKGTITEHGYKKIMFSHKGKKIGKYLHRLMAIYFLNFDETSSQVINHIDGNKLNNKLDNLRYISQQENLNAALYEQKLTNKYKPVSAYKNGQFIKNFPSIAAASIELGVDNSTISKICKGIGKTVHGYSFEYLE